MRKLGLTLTAFYTCLALLMSFSLSAKANALSIQNIRFGVHSDKVRLVLDLSDISDFRAFTLESPYRLVLDLPNFQWLAGSLRPAAGIGVTAIRQGALQTGVSRIVLDMDTPIAIKSAFVLPAQGANPNRLVVDFSKTNAQGFKAKKGQSFGTLSLDDMVRTAKSGGSSLQIEEATIRGNQTPLPTAKPFVKSPTPKKYTVIVDAGHGGVDPGAIGANKVYEKHITLALAKELKSQLEATGRYKVVLTRDRDVFIKLYDRVKIARRNKGDLFVSIHADSIKRANVRGASIYTLSEKASDTQTAKLAARENRADLIAGIDLSVEDQEVANILVDLAMRDTMNQSNFFANTIVDTMKTNNMKLLEKPHRYAGFAVLKAPDIPSVLIEVGFLSNRTEAKNLSKPSYRKKVATAIKIGIDAYFKVARENENG